MRLLLTLAASFCLVVLAGSPVAADIENVALGKFSRESSDWGGYPASNANDGNRNNFSHTATADTSPWWEVNLADYYQISSILLWNRSDCCPSRLRDITVMILDAPLDEGGIALYTSDLLNPEGILATPTATGPRLLSLDLVALTGFPVEGSVVRVTRTPDPDLSGNKEPAPNADDPNVLMLGEVEVYIGECTGSTATCDGLTVDGPPKGDPGVYTAIASSTSVPVFYRFTFSNGKDNPIVVGPQEDPMAAVVLGAGSWTVTVNVGDLPICISPDAAPACTMEVAVKDCSEDPKDTRCQGLTVIPPPGGPFPGIYTLTVFGVDDSMDPIAYTFSASNGVDPPLVAGPGLSETATFNLGVGVWTLKASLGDNTFCPPDETVDSVCSETVEVKVLSAKPNVAPLGTAVQSTGYAGGDPFPALLAIDGNFGNFTHTAADDLDPWWRVDLDDVYAIDAIKITNRIDCCRSRLRDITVSILDLDGGEVWKSDLLNVENELGNATVQIGPPSLTLSLIELTGGPIEGAAVKVGRLPDPDNSGASLDTSNPDEAAVLSLNEVEVFASLAELPASVVRDISRDTFGAETSIPVSLSVTAKTAGAAVKVVEVLPPGASAQGITEGGRLDPGAIEWNLLSVSSTILTYDLVVEATCVPTLKYPGSTFTAEGKKGKVRGEASLTRTISDDALSSWTSADINTTGGAAMVLGDHAVIVEAPGTGVKMYKDQFRSISLPATGDFEISARIDCANDPGRTGQAGLIVRESLEPDAAMAFIYFIANPPAAGGVGQVLMNFRRKTGNFAGLISSTVDKTVDVLPVWLRLRREGSILTFERSPDGNAWTSLATKEIGTGTSQIVLGADTFIGLALSAGGTGRAEFILGDVSGPVFTGIGGPNPPTGLTAVGGAKQVALSWNQPAEGPVPTSYAIFRDGAPLVEVAGTSYTDTAVVDGTPYCYKVKSKAGAAESAFTAEACATPQSVGAKFRRGDTNDDGKVDLSDAIVTLAYLFQGGTTPTCFDAVDADDSGVLDLTDGIYPLTWLFQGGPEPPAPGPKDCGIDTTPQKPGQKPFPACEYTKC